MNAEAHRDARRLAHSSSPTNPFYGALELIAALLVAAEIVILFAGVIARYVLHRPLVWSDELATLLFVWLAMLGSAVALHRSEHMRMTALVSRFGTDPRRKRALEIVGLAVPIVFLIAILYPSYEYAMEERIMLLPALDISTLWRAAALPVGLSLMLAIASLQVVARFGLRVLAIIVAGAIVAILAGVTLQPLFLALGNFNLLVFFVGVVGIGVFSGVPIAFSFGLASLGYLAMATHAPVILLLGSIEEGMSHLILLAVPLFVFLGMLLEMTGMADAMVRFCASLLGHVRGGLSYVLIAAMYLISGISGSKGADMAAVAPILFPEMKERGAKPGDLVALLAATGAQTETIPPSLILITVGSVTGISIAALFTGGLLPGVVLAVTLCLLVAWRYRHEDLSRVRKFTSREIMRAFIVALPALALPFVIRTAVVEGVATATEVSTIGIVYSIMVGLLIYRRFNWSRLVPMLVETASLSGSILLIIGCATAMAWGLVQSGFSHSLTRAMVGLPGGAAMFLAVSIVTFIILGSVLEGIPSIVLLGPLLFPIARDVGIHEVHYTMVVVLAMGLGLFSPPFGVGYYAACAIGRVNPDDGLGPIWGYMLALLVGIVIVAAVPWISTGFL